MVSIRNVTFQFRNINGAEYGKNPTNTEFPNHITFQLCVSAGSSVVIANDIIFNFSILKRRIWSALQTM